MKLSVTLTGWIAFLLACGTALYAQWFLATHTTTGSPTLTVGIVGGFLGYAAAAFGISAYEKAKTPKE